MKPFLLNAKGSFFLGFFAFLIIVGSCHANITLSDSSKGISIAPDFKITNENGNTYSLSDLKGSPAIIHITNIEIPLCRECEKDLKAQLEELSKLKTSYPDTQIITINLRKNPYSADGQSLVKKWWQINISWPWIEDLEPYKVAISYSDYWNVRGSFSNPTILLIDNQWRIAKLYHVYLVGEGEIDGVQSAQTLHQKIEGLNKSEWSGLEGEISRQNVTVLGMFFLGIVTSLAPCSIALMIAVFSYVLTIRRKDEYLRKNTSTSMEGFMIGVAFSLGMATVFFVLGLFISQVGVFLRDSRLFDLIAGTIMILLGISNIKPFEEMLDPVISLFKKPGNDVDREQGEGLIYRSVKTSVNLFKYSGFIGAFSLGVFFALGWAPCALSMVFPVLVWLAAQNVTPLAGGVMLFIFGLGHGVPIIPISTFSRTVGARIGNEYVSVGRWTTKFFGILVIAVGLVYAVRYFGFLLW
jgi:cytochrome c-type biogenesis protein